MHMNDLYLINFTNGVYDLNNGTFNEIVNPNHHISTGYDYVPYDENTMISQEIDEFMGKIFSNIEVREYFLSVVASCLIGVHNTQSFYILLGSESSGKSTLTNLINETFGGYSRSLNSSIICSRREDYSNPNDLERYKYVVFKDIRIGIFNELNSISDKINSGVLKGLIAGERLPYRALYGNDEYIEPRLKILFIMNELSGIDMTNTGLVRRMNIIPLLNKFVHKKDANVNKLPENHFIIDDSLPEKIKKWKQTFMGKIINYYHRYTKSGYKKIPDFIVNYTESLIKKRTLSL